MDDKRLVRIESKLTRLSIGLGLDSEGNPPTGAVIGKEMMEEIIDSLDRYLDVFDDVFPVGTKESEYNRIQTLYNKLVGIRRSRWGTTNALTTTNQN